MAAAPKNRKMLPASLFELKVAPGRAESRSCMICPPSDRRVAQRYCRALRADRLIAPASPTLSHSGCACLTLKRGRNGHAKSPRLLAQGLCDRRRKFHHSVALGERFGAALSRRVKALDTGRSLRLAHPPYRRVSLLHKAWERTEMRDVQNDEKVG